MNSKEEILLRKHYWLLLELHFQVDLCKSYRKIIGSNDRIRVGIVGFSNRSKYSLIPSFLQFSKKLNFEIVGVSDIWNRRRLEGAEFIKAKTGLKVDKWRNNEEMYEKNKIDSVIISTADFQHAIHTVEAAESKDVYVEKPFAETMDDAILGLNAVKKSKIIFQIGSQRRSGLNYHAAIIILNLANLEKWLW